MREIDMTKDDLREEVQGSREESGASKNGKVPAKKSDIYRRAFEFACRVVRMHQALLRKRGGMSHMLNQLTDSATSIGANLEEAKAAQSRPDFHAKVRVALKEARESHYWLRVFEATSIVKSKQISPLLREANEIVAILTTIAKKANPRQSTS
jgi:four helix bundle protein